MTLPTQENYLTQAKEAEELAQYWQLRAGLQMGSNAAAGGYAAASAMYHLCARLAEKTEEAA